jgi:glycosyltransferase involved in cell wall biosynthesis
MLLSAFEVLTRTVPEATLRIVGNGDLADLPFLEDLPKNVELDRRWVKDGEFSKLLEQADVLVFPYVEASQSGVLPLGLRAGIPTVITPVGGLVNQLVHEKSGLIAEDVSADAFAKQLIRLCSNEKLYAEISQGAIARARQVMTWRQFCDEVSRVMHA